MMLASVAFAAGPSPAPPAAVPITEASPTAPVGFYGLPMDALGSKASIVERHIFTGDHDTPLIGHQIELLDRGGVSRPGGARASYGLGITVQKQDWTRSPTAGEMDGISIVGRQGTGDFGGILANVGIRNGFGAALESYTFAADANGAPAIGLGTQLGVVNSRDGYQLGLLVQALEGPLLSGVRVSSEPAGSWSWAFQNVVSGKQNAGIRAADGAFVGGSLLPNADRSANLGDRTLRYQRAFANPVGMVRVVTDGRIVAATSDDELIVIRKARDPGKTDVRLPASPVAGQRFIVKDGLGDADRNPISISGGTIDGSDGCVISNIHGSVTLEYDGGQWVRLG